MRLADAPMLSRAAALAILGTLLLAFWFGPAAFYLDLVGRGGDDIAARAAVLQRYRALAQAPRATPATPPQAALLMPDMPDSQALAQLQETVKTAAAAAQVEVRGIQMLPAEALAGAVRLGMRIRAAGDVAALGRLLHAIEANRPMLIPDNLQVQSRMAAPATASSSAPAPLEFQLDITGFKPAAAS